MKKNSRGVVHIFVLIIIILLAIGVIGYLVYQNSQLRKGSFQPQSSTPSLTPTSSDDSPSLPITSTPTGLQTETLSYTPQPLWSTYTDSVSGFSIQYPSDYIADDNNQEGKSAAFIYCPEELKAQKKCVSRFTLSIHNNYEGGSRRVWLKENFDPYQPYYKNLIIGGQKALLAIEGNPGGSSSMMVAIPKGSTMITYSKSWVA
jgi:hypothetical protein